VPDGGDANGNTNGDSTGGPRRSALLQERSRNTRRELVRAALGLWNERGFERGIEETTVEEIARAAGVTKGTFYFHFAHKEDILFELGWAAADAMIDDANSMMARGDRAADVIDGMVVSLARRVGRTPRAAVIRAAREFSRPPHDWPARPDAARGFIEAFEAVVRYAVGQGYLPTNVDAKDVAALLQAATMDTLQRWAASSDGSAELSRKLQRRAQLVLSGASVVYGWGAPDRAG
jgi:AcrR family transcriptional regulator